MRNPRAVNFLSFAPLSLSFFIVKGWHQPLFHQSSTTKAGERCVLSCCGHSLNTAPLTAATEAPHSTVYTQPLAGSPTPLPHRLWQAWVQFRQFLDSQKFWVRRGPVQNLSLVSPPLSTPFLFLLLVSGNACFPRFLGSSWELEKLLTLFLLKGLQKLPCDVSVIQRIPSPLQKTEKLTVGLGILQTS